MLCPGKSPVLDFKILFLALLMLGVLAAISIRLWFIQIRMNVYYCSRIQGKKWSQGQTANTSIGQGYVLANPLQMAMISATVAKEILALERGYDPGVQALAPAAGNFHFVKAIDIRGTVVRAQPAARDEEAEEIVPAHDEVFLTSGENRKRNSQSDGHRSDPKNDRRKSGF